MKNWIAQLTGAPSPNFELRPETAFQVIGDIHGRADLLTQMLDQLDPDLPIICVGDYIDRGENGREVLEILSRRPDITCLMGNHEFMMLSFLAYPARHGRRWLRYGGLQTLASYGVATVRETSSSEEFEQARDMLVSRIGEPVLGWLVDLPFQHHNGNIAVVHAGADPHAPISDQSPGWLMWGHPNFRKISRTDGQCVVYGHTIVDQPAFENGRIAIDTGAYATGRLTAARISSDGVEFITTGR